MLASTLFQDINEEDMGQGEILAVTALSVINIIYIYIYIYIRFYIKWNIFHMQFTAK